jgi:hypothetical protein
MLEAVLILVLVMVGTTLGWNNRDIGIPSAPGSASYDAGTGKWTVTADGNDFWAHSDNFHYVYTSLMGDGHLTARVVNLLGPGTNGWAKAGVMIREDLSPESKHATMAMTPTAGQAVAFQWRPVTGEISNTTHSGSMTFPYWVRIERMGNFFTGYHSPDGITWSFQGTAFIPMGMHTYIGLAVTSHQEGVLRTAEFDNVTIAGQIGMGTAFTYQGRLIDANGPGDGSYDFRFKLYDSDDVQQGSAVDINDLDVIDGYFTTELDFGGSVFNGAARWLDIGVRPGDSTGSFTSLTPRQEVTPVPYSLQTRGIFVDSAGNVGIGTKNPKTRLSLGAEIPPALKKLAIWDGIDDFYGFGADWGRMTIYAGDEEKMTIQDSGNVGISTTDPQQKLDVDLGNIVVQGTGSFDATGEEGTVYLGSIHHYIKGVHGFGVKIGTYGVGDALSIEELSGRVGIGTTTPQEKLHVSGRARFDLGSGNINMSTPGGWPGIIAFAPNGHRRDIAYDDWSMSISVSSSSSPPATGNGIRIFEDGKVAVKILQITGGSDMAEPFDVKETDAVKAGMVLSIDPENAGKLKISQKAYDRCVAGIISGAGGVEPGMLMTQSGSVADGDCPVALTGRVYCFADASYGKIQPGDLLTTSDTPGHAMKVADYNRAQGAVLGKAMTNLDQGRGMVLVLVTLQ